MFEQIWDSNLPIVSSVFICILKALIEKLCWNEFECNVLADLGQQIAFCFQRFLCLFKGFAQNDVFDGV